MHEVYNNFKIYEKKKILQPARKEKDCTLLDFIIINLAVTNFTDTL